MEDIVNWERRKGVDNSKQLCLIFAFQKKKKKLCLIFSTVDYITVLLFRKQCVTDKTLCLLWGGWLELYLFDEVWVSYSSVKMWGSDLFFLQMQIVVCGGFLFLPPLKMPDKFNKVQCFYIHSLCVFNSSYRNCLFSHHQIIEAGAFKLSCFSWNLIWPKL